MLKCLLHFNWSTGRQVLKHLPCRNYLLDDARSFPYIAHPIDWSLCLSMAHRSGRNHLIAEV